MTINNIMTIIMTIIMMMQSWPNQGVVLQQAIVQVLLKKLKRIQKAALEVQKLSQQTIAIMKSYNKPPDVVVQVNICRI